MPVVSTVLFGLPNQEIASILRQKLGTSTFTQIVSGFVTVEGMKAIEPAIFLNIAVLDTFIVGAGTYRAYESFDRLLNAGVSTSKLFVHLGHTRLTTSSAARHKFLRYHPMLHSKVYYTEHADGSASAVIGSHNVTGFALMGLNGEAAVLLEGPKQDQQFQRIRQHIAGAKVDAVQYQVGMREAYSWWASQFIEGLGDKVRGDMPKDAESARTIVIIAEAPPANFPKPKDKIYFELPRELGSISSLKAEVHLFLFKTLPPTPMDGLNNLANAIQSFWCKTVGLEWERGGVELRANWYIDDHFQPKLLPTPATFRPTPTKDMQQVRVQAYSDVRERFQYLFNIPLKKWLPVLSENRKVQASQSDQQTLIDVELTVSEDGEWYWVSGLQSQGENEGRYADALKRASPASGSYVMMSLLRRKAVEHDTDEEIE